MRVDWLKSLWRSLAILDTPTYTPPHKFTRFDLGFCRGCRLLRSAASLSCQHCGSTQPVDIDA